MENPDPAKPGTRMCLASSLERLDLPPPQLPGHGDGGQVATAAGQCPFGAGEAQLTLNTAGEARSARWLTYII